MLSFARTVAALCESIVRARCEPPPAELEARGEELTRFVLAQHARMPDPMRTPFKLFTLLFDLLGVAYAGRPFHRQPHAARWRQIECWRSSSLSPRRDLVRFYESLALYHWYSDDER